MATEIISLKNVRRNRVWLKNFEQVDPVLRAIEQAPENEKKARLFSGACRLREMIDDGLLSHRQAWRLLREAMQGMWTMTDLKLGPLLPQEEIDRTISAGLFKARR
jgi:hypothetical protein